MKILTPYTPFFVFDVESIGLHGEGFAVAGGIYINGAAQTEFRYSCDLQPAEGEDDDRHWCLTNIPILEITHRTPELVREAFWAQWIKAKDTYPGILMTAECGWPVEAGFVARCIYQDMPARKWAGPYPFHEIASFMLAAGMDPMATYDRLPSELPKHEPLADARQSARLLAQAIARIQNKTETPLPA